MSVSVGIGLTNECNLTCQHCYRGQGRVDRLSLDDVRLICDHVDASAFGFGTGENGLHPQFVSIIEYLWQRGHKMTLASNGYTLNTMPDHLLPAFHDLEVSLDFPTEAGQDAFRGAGNWREVLAAIERCREAGVQVSLLAVMMSVNYDKMDALAALAASLGANLRVNVYQPVHTNHFSLDYEQFWEGYRRLFDAAGLVSTSEPLVNAVLGLDDLAGSPCGHRSIRFTPRGHILPCVYWPEPELHLADLPALGTEGVLDSAQFRRARHVPHACRSCPHVSTCGGGCASRRALRGDLNQPDEYCPIVRDDDLHLSFSPAPSKDLPRGRNVCTTIVSR